MTRQPEQVAAEACARTVWSLAGTTDARAEHIGKACVEAISAAELVIVPAGRMAQLLEIERAALGPLADIAAERRRQIEAEGWTSAHDDMHVDGEMARAAAVYALNSAGVVRLQFSAELAETVPQDWPWSLSWYRPTEPRRALVKAGALIVAEIERLDRAAAAKQAQMEGREQREVPHG